MNWICQKFCNRNYSAQYGHPTLQIQTSALATNCKLIWKCVLSLKMHVANLKFKIKRVVFEWHHLLELFLIHKHRFFDMLFECGVYMMSGRVWWFARLIFSTTFKVPKSDSKVQRRSMISKDSSTNVYVVIGGVDTNWSECERNKKF